MKRERTPGVTPRASLPRNRKERGESQQSERCPSWYSLEYLEARVLLSTDIPSVLHAAVATDNDQAAALVHVLGEGNEVVVHETDGTAVAFRLSGTGSGEVIENASGWDLRVTGTDAQSILTIVASGGDGVATMHDAHVQGQLGILTAMNTDLTGTLAVDGNMHSLTLGSVHVRESD